MSNQTRQRLLQGLARALPDLQDANDSFDEAAAEVLGINRTDLRVLGSLVRGGSLTPSALADLTGLSRSAMTTALDRLERAGHLRRVPDTTDRRSVRVEATPEAMRSCGGIWGPMAREGELMLAKYSDEELEALGRVLGESKAIQERHTERVRALLGKRRR